MEIFYKGKYYELVELKEPNGRASFDIVAIFESNYTKEENGNEIPTTKEDFESNLDCSWRLGNFINYFFGASVETLKSMETIAKDYIDEYESGKNATLLNLLSALAQKRIQEHKRTTTKDFDKLSKDEQFELDDGDNLLQAIDTIKGVLEDGEKN